jgi:phosphotransferase system  glucose/maltose/N-acetylglucosamine-specific IIC component
MIVNGICDGVVMELMDSWMYWKILTTLFYFIVIFFFFWFLYDVHICCVLAKEM